MADINKRIHVITGDITELEVDAIVNAANSSLMGGGGVDGAIHRVGGPEILKQCKDIRRHDFPKGVPTGKAVITTGGELPAQYVIHAVGPVWNGGDQNEEALLEAAYRNSLDVAAGRGVSSIAFPAISTGVYGYPKEEAALVAYRAVAKHLQRNTVPRDVFFVFFSDADRELFIKALEE
jgi:O-acetyl-ADP-ribose deacetylase